MQLTTYKVNENGLQEIKAFLGENHKLGEAHFNHSMLRAWANESEFQLDQGNPATIEIKAYDSVHGHTQEYTISDAGLDSYTEEIDD